MIRGKRPVWVVVAVLALSVSIGCQREKAARFEVQPVPESRDDNGWPRYEIKKEGFALSLPPDWRQFDMNAESFDSMMNEVLAKNPEFQSMLSGLRQQIAAGVKFFGFDPSEARSGFATNVNVLRMPMPTGVNRDAIVSESVRQLEGLPNVVKPIHRGQVSVSGASYDTLRYRMRMRGPTGRNDVLAMTQYLAVGDDSYYVLTLTTLADREAKHTSTFEQVGRSFRIIDR